MGQRHQTFIAIWNPYKQAERALKQISKEQIRNDMAFYLEKKKELAKMKSEFGTGAKTVLAFHHQWLYGATALAIAYNFMNFLSEIEDDRHSNPFNKDFGMDAKSKVELVTNILRVHRFIPGFTGRKTGFENFHYLNVEEPEMREDPLCGDNNDGITIIDTTTGKYCFMNIGYGDSNIMKAKKKTPLSANEYLKCYYPESLADEDKEEKKEFKKLSEEKQEEKLKVYAQNVEHHNKARELFKDFGVLSLDELSDIFPKVFNKKKLKTPELV